MDRKFTKFQTIDLESNPDLDLDLHLNIEDYPKEENNSLILKRKLRNRCIFLICSLVILGIYIGIVSGCYIYNSYDLNQFIESKCDVINTHIIDICSNQTQTDSYCFQGYWYVEEKHYYNAVYRMGLLEYRIGKPDKIKFKSKKYVEQKINEHPIGSNSTCWYHTRNGIIYWIKSNKIEFYFDLLIVSCSIVGLVLFIILIFICSSLKKYYTN